MSTALSRVGISESQAIAQAMPQVALHRRLRDALVQFRDLWQEGIPERLHESADHVEPGHLGGPVMTDRFRRWLLDGPRTPMRLALAEMARGGLADRAGARFLFVLACRDFDVRSAGLAMARCRCLDVRHARPADCPAWALPIGPEHVAWYAERAIARALEIMARPSRPRSLYRVCDEPGCDKLTDHESCEGHRVLT